MTYKTLIRTALTVDFNIHKNQLTGFGNGRPSLLQGLGLYECVANERHSSRRI